MILKVNPEGRVTFSYRTEADLQQGIAEYAELCGWETQREVHIPGWGRVDVLADGVEAKYAIEVKVSLERPRDIRRALQQADGYFRALNPDWPYAPESCRVFLVAPTLGPDVADYARHYSDIDVTSVAVILAHLAVGTGFTRRNAAALRSALESRLDAAKALASYSEVVNESLRTTA